jgi:hypothetical protein
MNPAVHSQLAAVAGDISEQLAGLETVAWSALAAGEGTQPLVAQLRTILADIAAAVAAADVDRLTAAYIALNNLESRLPNTPVRGLVSQTPDPSTDPIWQELRVNEVIDKLVALTSPSEQPQADSGRKRFWWRREKR